MFTVDYLFDKKIIWLGDDSICLDNWSSFKSELIALLETVKQNSKYFKIGDSLFSINQIENELQDSGCLWYLRFRLAGEPRISFYVGSEFDLEDARENYREWIDSGYKSLEWSDLTGGDIDVEDIFKNLNESIGPESKGFEPEVGDFLYCHTNLVMEDDDAIEATKDSIYEIISIDNTPFGDELVIKNNSKYEHKFSINPNDEGSYYGKWFTLMPRKYVEDIDVDIENVFKNLNESFDRTLIGKKIWFDHPTERKDIEKVNQFLIDNGYRGLDGDNIDELEDFIYDHDVAYFYLVQHDSPLHSEERRKPYIDYGYMDWPNPYRLRAKPNWIYYKDITEMPGFYDIFDNLTESTQKYDIRDIETFYNIGTNFYELNQGKPVISDNIINDGIGNLYHIGHRDGQYCACYYLPYKEPVEECIQGQNSLLKWINNGDLILVEDYGDKNFGDEMPNIFNQLNESEYQPKLYLKFQPPIYNDTVGVGQLNKVLKTIEDLYPKVTWWDGQSPSEYNPFNIEEDIPDQIATLTIGYWSNGPNRLTFGQWGDNDQGYKNLTDGWQWLKDNQLDYDEISDIFSQLNESTEGYQPKLNLRFERGISDADDLDKVLNVLTLAYPGLKWTGGATVENRNVIRDNEDGDQDFYYEPIYYLTIGFFPSSPDSLTYTNAPRQAGDGIDIADSEHHAYNWVDGWQWLEDNQIDYDEISNIFNQLK